MRKNEAIKRKNKELRNNGAMRRNNETMEQWVNGAKGRTVRQWSNGRKMSQDILAIKLTIRMFMVQLVVRNVDKDKVQSRHFFK